MRPLEGSRFVSCAEGHDSSTLISSLATTVLGLIAFGVLTKYWRSATSPAASPGAHWTLLILLLALISGIVGCRVAATSGRTSADREVLLGFVIVAVGCCSGLRSAGCCWPGRSLPRRGRGGGAARVLLRDLDHLHNLVPWSSWGVGQPTRPDRRSWTFRATQVLWVLVCHC